MLKRIATVLVCIFALQTANAQTLPANVDTQTYNEINDALLEAGFITQPLDRDTINQAYQDAISDYSSNNSGNSGTGSYDASMQSIMQQINEVNNFSDKHDDIINRTLQQYNIPEFGGIQTEAAIGDAFATTQQIQSQIELELIPNQPNPGEDFTVRLNDYNIQSNGSLIRWLIDGEELVQQANQRYLNLTAPGYNDSMEITVELKLPTGIITSETRTVKPVRVDLIVDADSTVPVFYKGRSLPVRQGPVTVTAFTFGQGIDDIDSLSYQWYMGSTVIGGGSQRGKHTVTFEQDLRTIIPISLLVFNEQGEQIAEVSKNIPLVAPEVVFYETNPLRGLSQNAINDKFILVGNESTLSAEIYNYDNRASLANWGWKLNGRNVGDTNTNSNEITLTKNGNAGQATLEFNYINRNKLLQNLSEKILVEI